jgi:hypothetical protein
MGIVENFGYSVGQTFTLQRKLGSFDLVIVNITDKRVVFQFTNQARTWAYGPDRFRRMLAR